MRSAGNGTASPSSSSTTSPATTPNAKTPTLGSGSRSPLSGTTLTEIFGVGPVIAATLLGHTGDVARFANADRFAAYNGTAPIEWSSGNPKRPTHRLSRRGNRTMNHALHIAAVTQLRHAHSPGRAFYDRKREEGHTTKTAIRALKRRLSNVVYRHLVADTQRARTGR